MNNNKIVFFHIAVEFKIRFHRKRRTNYKFQRKLQSLKKIIACGVSLFI